MLETGGDVIITIRHNGHNAGPARASNQSLISGHGNREHSQD